MEPGYVYTILGADVSWVHSECNNGNRRRLHAGKIAFASARKPYPGADPGFFLGGGALVSCSTSIPISHIVFFYRIPVVLENRRSSQGGGGGCAPPAPSP